MELILRRDTEQFFEELIKFENGKTKSPAMLHKIFEMKALKNYPKPLKEFVYASLALLTDKTLDLDAWLGHEFLTEEKPA